MFCMKILPKFHEKTLCPLPGTWRFPLRISSVNVTKSAVWSHLLKKSLIHFLCSGRSGVIKIFRPGRRMYMCTLPHIYGRSFNWGKAINEMGGNTPGGNFLGGNFPVGSLMGGNFLGQIFLEPNLRFDWVYLNCCFLFSYCSICSFFERTFSSWKALFLFSFVKVEFRLTLKLFFKCKKNLHITFSITTLTKKGSEYSVNMFKHKRASYGHRKTSIKKKFLSTCSKFS